MRTVLLLALAACTTPRDVPDAVPPDGPPDAEIVDPYYDRTVNRALVAGDFVFWTHGRFECSLEYPCPLGGAAVTAWWSGNNHASPRYEGGVGARSIVGTADERFFVTGLDFDSMYVVRDRGNAMAFSIPRPMTLGPAIDATHVYWADTTDYGQSYTLRRATRTGDGGDATVVAANVQMYTSSELVHAAGYLWWILNGKVRRVPATGGAPVTVAPELPEYPVTLTALGDVVYVASAPNSSTPSQTTEIGRIDAGGTYTRVAAQPCPPTRWPSFLVATADALYWSQHDGNIYRVPIAGGAIETIAANDQVGYAFAVLPDRILVELTGDSFRTIPR